MAVLGKSNVGPTIQVSRLAQGSYGRLSDSTFSPPFQHMWDQEKVHLKEFQKILPEYRVRPTALLPLWRVAGFALGKKLQRHV